MLNIEVLGVHVVYFDIQHSLIAIRYSFSFYFSIFTYTFTHSLIYFTPNIPVVMPDDNNIEQMHDSQLWQNFKHGDKEALGSLARRHYASLLRYGVALDNDKAFVQDSIQDLFVTLWEKRSDIASANHVKAYLLTALRHRLIHDKMKLEREKTRFEKWFSKPETLDSFEVDWINTEKEKENHQRIHTILSQLSPRQKEIVQLKFYEGMDNESIAEVMGITKQGVANLLVRTIKDLRLSWQQMRTLLFIFLF